jgi:hypothetical protein
MKHIQYCIGHFLRKPHTWWLWSVRPKVGIVPPHDERHRGLAPRRVRTKFGKKNSWTIGTNNNSSNKNNNNDVMMYDDESLIDFAAEGNLETVCTLLEKEPISISYILIRANQPLSR